MASAPMAKTGPAAFLLLCTTLLSACSTGFGIDRAITEYDEVEDRIQLGDPKEAVLAILEPTQVSVPRNSRKKSDRYLKDGVHVEILYMRTGHQRDGITTDDEFTPYVFHDGKLVGIGWHMLGGPKSHGQVKPDRILGPRIGHPPILIY